MSDRALVLNDFLPYRLAYTSGVVSEIIAEAYRALFDLSIPEWRVIAHAAESGGITQQAIGTRSRMDKVTVSRAAITLVGRGLLVRAPNPHDRRSHLLVLSEAGRNLYAQVAPKALELEARLFAGFPAEDVATLRAMLARIDVAATALKRALAPGATA